MEHVAGTKTMLKWEAEKIKTYEDQNVARNKILAMTLADDI